MAILIGSLVELGAWGIAAPNGGHKARLSLSPKPLVSLYMKL